MFKGKPNQKQELTGFDILLAMASELRDVDTEYASLYLLMLEGFLMPQEHVMFGTRPSLVRNCTLTSECRQPSCGWLRSGRSTTRNGRP